MPKTLTQARKIRTANDGRKRHQHRVKTRHGFATRKKLTVAVLEQIEDRIRQTEERFNVSRSFVIAVALADFFGINHERYNI